MGKEKYRKSTVLVDMKGLARTLDVIQSDFTILEFLDLCTTIEAIILNDQIRLISNEPEETDYTDEIKALDNVGILDRESLYVPKPEPRPILKKYGSKRFKINLDKTIPELQMRSPFTTSTLEDAYNEASLLIDGERISNISALPLRRYAAFYEPQAKVKEEHTICNLSGQYEKLSDHLTKSRSSTRFGISPYILTHIPPLPILVLKRSQSRDNILSTVLELREEFEKLRFSLSSLRVSLGDSDISPHEKIKLTKSWSKSWSTLDKYNSNSILNLGNTSLESIDVDKSLDGESIDFNLNKLVSRLLKEGTKKFYQWRIRVLHRNAEQYLRTSDNQISNEVNRLFNHQLSSKDLNRLNDWEERMKNVPELFKSEK